MTYVDCSNDLRYNNKNSKYWSILVIRTYWCCPLVSNRCMLGTTLLKAVQVMMIWTRFKLWTTRLLDRPSCHSLDSRTLYPTLPRRKCALFPWYNVSEFSPQLLNVIMPYFDRKYVMCIYDNVAYIFKEIYWKLSVSEARDDWIRSIVVWHKDMKALSVYVQLMNHKMMH